MQSAEQMENMAKLLRLQAKHEKNHGKAAQKERDARDLETRAIQKRNEEKFT